MTDLLSVRPLCRGWAPLALLRSFRNCIHLTLVCGERIYFEVEPYDRGLVNRISDDINRADANRYTCGLPHHSLAYFARFVCFIAVVCARGLVFLTLLAGTAPERASFLSLK